MKFMCLAYEDEAILNGLSPSEWEALRGETIAYVDSLRAIGHLVSTYALQSKRTAATVKVPKRRVVRFTAGKALKDSVN